MGITTFLQAATDAELDRLDLMGFQAGDRAIHNVLAAGLLHRARFEPRPAQAAVEGAGAAEAAAGAGAAAAGAAAAPEGASAADPSPATVLLADLLTAEATAAAAAASRKDRGGRDGAPRLNPGHAMFVNGLGLPVFGGYLGMPPDSDSDGDGNGDAPPTQWNMEVFRRDTDEDNGNVQPWLTLEGELGEDDELTLDGAGVTHRQHDSVETAVLAVLATAHAKRHRGYCELRDPGDAEFYAREEALPLSVLADLQRQGLPTLGEVAARGLHISLDKAAEGVGYTAALALQAASGSDALLPADPESIHLLDNLFRHSHCVGDDVCYGPVRLVLAREVARVHRLLQQVSAEAFAQAFQPQRNDWPSVLGALVFDANQPNPDDPPYLALHFAGLKAFVEHCATNGLGLVIHYW